MPDNDDSTSKDQPVDVLISGDDLEKLRSAKTSATLIKGFIREGKLTVTGIQHEFSSPFRHNWPPTEE